MSVKDRNAKRQDLGLGPKGESLTAKPERTGAIGMTTNPTEELVELKPCPFDGEPAKLSIGNTSAWVLCTKPGCGCEQTHDTAQQAIAAWNTRAALESTRNDERTLKLVEALMRAARETLLPAMEPRRSEVEMLLCINRALWHIDAALAVHPVPERGNGGQKAAEPAQKLPNGKTGETR